MERILTCTREKRNSRVIKLGKPYDFYCSILYLSINQPYMYVHSLPSTFHNYIISVLSGC